MSDLITRLESATEGSHEFDREIMALDGWTLDEIGNPIPMWIAPVGRKFPHGTSRNVSAVSGDYPYTRMVDAALTLVPEGWFVWHIGQTEPGDDWSVILNNAGHRGVDIEFIGTTLPLALVIAALKARSL